MRAASTRGGRLWLHQIELLDVPGHAHLPDTPRVEDADYLRLLCRLAEVLRAAAEPIESCERAFALLWETVPADVGVLFLVGESGAPAPVVVRSKVKIPLGEIPVSRTVVDRVLREKVALKCDDIRDDSRFRAGSSLFLYNVRSVIAVPLLAGPRVLGVVYLHRGPGNSFESRDLDVVVAVAHMVALGVERPGPAGVAPRRQRLGVDAAAAVTLCAGERGAASVARALQEDELAAYYGEQTHLVREAVRAEGGVLASEGADALVALFPLAAADPQRATALAALRAASAMRSACAGRLRRITGAGLGIALDAGPVDAGWVSSGEHVVYVALGAPVAGARDLHRRASPSDILLSSSAEAALEGAVTLQPLPVAGGVASGARRLFSLPPGTVLPPKP